MKKGKWSEEEILYLKNNYQTKDINEICLYLDRTLDSVRYKASKLGIKSKDIFLEIKNELHNNNYEMLSTEYNGIKAFYDIKCIKHNFKKKSTGDCILQRKYGCPYCKSDKIHSSLITDIEVVREVFINKGLIPKFENDEYINNKTPLKYLCPKHNNDYQYITFDSLNRSMFGCIYCAGQYRGENYCGEKHHMWKGGVVNEKQKLRETPEYSQWLKAIFKRDNYMCQCCGARDGNGYTVHLRGHHLLPFATYEDKRFDVDNGITLCDKCHDVKYEGSFHNIYGTHNNTPEQLYEYIENYKKLHKESQNNDSLLLCSNE